ncbi:MAG: hypothetical protein B7Z01_08120 [Brevundimonas subvibrioides]|uniref:TonB-dependent receptor plug domain-containing protein n=1 Tax=Brevundimonas subvibrioides TaxID=74313 RepID=A0A258FNK4_9CAUL|nr:MAG: hypothetical protein B7Z01_08120 [Brevundimonas subvibrioides]
MMSQTNRAHGTRTVILAGVAFAALASVAAPASAQDAPGGQEASAVEDIVVTARRREEALQDVPIAVTAFTEEALQNQQIEDLIDVARYTPGVQIQQAFGRDGDRPVIRGASNILTGDGKVGIFLDGVPWFGDFSTLDLDLAQRVEVIRGPQSAVGGCRRLDPLLPQRRSRFAFPDLAAAGGRQQLLPDHPAVLLRRDSGADQLCAEHRSDPGARDRARGRTLGRRRELGHRRLGLCPVLSGRSERRL